MDILRKATTISSTATAHESKLSRDVAIKVLLRTVANDPDRGREAVDQEQIGGRAFSKDDLVETR